MSLFFDLIQEARDLLKAQQEINPLLSKKPNPVKTMVRLSAKALRSGKPEHIRAARVAHTPAIKYAEKHGLPRLQAQLVKHKLQLAKKPPKKILKRKKASPSKRT